MEPAPAAAASRPFSDAAQKRAWPAERPTVNTGVPNPVSAAAGPASAASPLPSASDLSTPGSSYPSSPWNSAASASQPLSFTSYYDAPGSSSAQRQQQSSSSPQMNPTLTPAIDWNSMLQAPLDLATFTALENSGVLPPPSKTSYAPTASSHYLPQGTPSLLTNMSAQSSSAAALRESWSAATTPPYSPSHLSNSQRTSPSQSPQSASGLSQAVKGKSAAQQGQFPPYQPRPESVLSNGSGSANSSERGGAPEVKGFVNLQQALSRNSLVNRRQGMSMGVGAGMGGGMGMGAGGGGGGAMGIGQHAASANEVQAPTAMRLGMPPPAYPSHLGAVPGHPHAAANSYPSSGERPYQHHSHPIALPPSLMMSPATTQGYGNPYHPYALPHASHAQANHGLAAAYGLPPLTMPTGPMPSLDTAPSSASSSKLSSSSYISGPRSAVSQSTLATELKSPAASMYSDILADDWRTHQKGGAMKTPFSMNFGGEGPVGLGGMSLSPPPSASRGSPDLSGLPSLGGLGSDDPEQMARDDPLMSQVWRMYVRTRAALPHAQRMENLTWRMMTLALKKREDAKAQEQAASSANSSQTQKGEPTVKQEGEASSLADTRTGDPQRGRRQDKNAARVRVVGFEGKNQDGEEEECAYTHSITLLSNIKSDIKSLFQGNRRWTGGRSAAHARAYQWTGALRRALAHDHRANRSTRATTRRVGRRANLASRNMANSRR